MLAAKAGVVIRSQKRIKQLFTYLCCRAPSEAGPSMAFFLVLAGFGGFLSSSGANVMAWSEFKRRSGKDKRRSEWSFGHVPVMLCVQMTFPSSTSLPQPLK